MFASPFRSIQALWNRTTAHTHVIWPNCRRVHVSPRITAVVAPESVPVPRVWSTPVAHGSMPHSLQTSAAGVGLSVSHEDPLLVAKRVAITTYMKLAVTVWACAIAAYVAFLGGGHAAVWAALTSIHLPCVDTIHLVTLVAFAVVLWTDTSSMLVCTDAGKRALFRLMLMINGMPAVTYTLILSGLAPPSEDLFGRPTYVASWMCLCGGRCTCSD